MVEYSKEDDEKDTVSTNSEYVEETFEFDKEQNYDAKQNNYAEQTVYAEENVNAEEKDAREHNYVENDTKEHAEEYDVEEDNVDRNCKICRDKINIIGKAKHWQHSSFFGLWLSMGESAIAKHLKR
jgi:hypothetical protein